VRYFCPAGSGRRAVPVLVEDGTGRRTIITKGAPEGLLERCAEVSPPPAACPADLGQQNPRGP